MDDISLPNTYYKNAYASVIYQSTHMLQPTKEASTRNPSPNEYLPSYAIYLESYAIVASSGEICQSWRKGPKYPQNV